MTSSVHKFPMAKARNQGLASLYYVEETLAQAGVPVRVDRGTTDEGDHWIAILNEFDDVIAHVAHIDGEFVVASPAFSDIVRGRDIKRLLDKLLDSLRSFGIARNGLLNNQNVLLAAVIALAALHLPDADAAWWAPLTVNEHSGIPAHIGAVPAIALLHVVELAHDMADGLGQLFFSESQTQSQPIATVQPPEEFPNLPPSSVSIDMRHEAVDMPQTLSAPKIIAWHGPVSERPAPVTAPMELVARGPAEVSLKEAEQPVPPAELPAKKTDTTAPSVASEPTVLVVTSQGQSIMTMDEARATILQVQLLDAELGHHSGDITLTLPGADHAQQTVMTFNDSSTLTLIGVSAESAL
ncbi:hypothetical protein CHELA1G11_11274 [Hyphomicrobiales bacterium]|nr:hypothetical protein CHELA1G11_11274 [Hyphomicrobiales bacterium]CAH1668913.1 hypothetical protein CHELA1G2_13035 [Hyphomicrobiales bacterium]